MLLLCQLDALGLFQPASARVHQDSQGSAQLLWHAYARAELLALGSHCMDS